MNPKEVDRTNTFCHSIVYTKFEENAQNDFEKNAFKVFDVYTLYTRIYIACICKRRIYMKGL